jgi:hypothetical protein
MDGTSHDRRVTGALRFLAELSSVASECAATWVWDDELTARRRLRDDSRGAGVRTAEDGRVKAL